MLGQMEKGSLLLFHMNRSFSLMIGVISGDLVLVFLLNTFICKIKMANSLFILLNIL